MRSLMVSRRRSGDLGHLPLRRLRLTGLLLLTLLLAAGSLLFFWPDGAQIRRVHIDIWLAMTPTPGLRRSITPEMVSDLFNALAFIPLSLGLALTFPRIRVAVWAVLAFVLSCGIELTQLLLMSGRRFELADLAANTAGGIIGALLGWLVLRRALRGPRPAGRAGTSRIRS